jgi:hypothetical protein
LVYLSYEMTNFLLSFYQNLCSRRSYISGALSKSLLVQVLLHNKHMINIIWDYYELPLGTISQSLKSPVSVHLGV